jgi:hypothetical protein
MSTDINREIRELKDMVASVARTVITIKDSLRTCQSRCHVDNPPGRWRGLYRALRALVSPTREEKPASSRAEVAVNTDS